MIEELVKELQTTVTSLREIREKASVLKKSRDTLVCQIAILGEHTLDEIGNLAGCGHPLIRNILKQKNIFAPIKPGTLKYERMRQRVSLAKKGVKRNASNNNQN